MAETEKTETSETVTETPAGTETEKTTSETRDVNASDGGSGADKPER